MANAVIIQMQNLLLLMESSKSISHPNLSKSYSNYYIKTILDWWIKSTTPFIIAHMYILHI